MGTLAFLLVVLTVGIFAVLLALNALLSIVRVRIPFVTSPRWVRDWLVRNLTLPDGATVVELGCGDARLLAALARQFPRVRCVGYEVAWWPLLLARLRTMRLRNVAIIRRDFFEVPLDEADVLYGYLIGSVMPRLENKLQRELRPGSRMYSYTFQFPSWPVAGSVIDPHNERIRLWVYVKGGGYRV
ncbi:MAG: hypothetical protein HYZ09_01420 [Candidatus Kerfeldbacteria bacterium]|nr:hypothetical protein [Candidatus Kerfeldbacteria bacterium]